MSRVFRPQSAANERRKLLQSLALAVSASLERELDQSEKRDLMAFTLQILDEIAASVKTTVSAWEKRGYWVKADSFMEEWKWIGPIRNRIQDALLRDDDWPQPAIISKLKEHLTGTTPSASKLKEKPWMGSWSRGENQATAQ